MDDFSTEMRSTLEDLEKESSPQSNIQPQDSEILPYYFPGLFAEGAA